MKGILKIFRSKEGQSTVEFAIVTAAVITLVIGFGLVWRLGDNGIFVDHAISSASHHLQEAAAGIVGDLFSC